MNPKIVVTRDNLGFEFHENEDEPGMYARFDATGRLTLLAYSPETSGLGAHLEIDYQDGSAQLSLDQFHSDADDDDSDSEDAFGEFVLHAVEEVRRKMPTAGFFCDFCKKGESEVAKLIAGPTASICAECVELCNEIIETSVN